MAQAFKFELVSPERLLVSRDVESVVIPGSEGEMTIMSNHAPTMTAIKPGVVTLQAGSESDSFVVFGGFADILPEGCTLLAESAVRVADIDKADIERRIAAAREDVADAKDEAKRSAAETYLEHLTTLQAAL